MAIQNIAGPQSSLDYRIRYAIAHKRLVEVTYQRYARIAEPHDYGRDNGVDRLLIYQRRGPAKPGRPPMGWRLFDVAKIESLLVLDQEFDGGRGTDRQQHHDWDEVYARVSPR